MIKTLIPKSILLATTLGIFGQGISYFINDNIAKTHPIYYLTISMILYLTVPLFAYISFERKKIEKDKFVSYLAVTCIIGIPTSFWSVFVLAMWWG